MDPRTLALAVPTAAALALLVAHSLRALPRRRALAFWLAAACYGVARGVALRAVVERGLGASFPYRIERPLWPVAGVPLQEIAGWAIVAYLGWWLGDRFAAGGGEPRRALFRQLAWACLFLGAVSWAIEAGAVAAGWWHWTAPVRWPLLGNVPFIGLVDWFFVGTDFLLPFLALTAPSLRRVGWRWATLAAFPLHFAAHLAVERPSQWLPIPLFHLAHWALLAGLVWAAARSRRDDAAFAVPEGRARFLPLAALGVIAIDLALVETVLVGRPELVASLLPVAAVVAQALRPQWGYRLAALGLAGALAHPSLALAAVPAGVAMALDRLRRAGRPLLAAATVALALLAWAVHRRGLETERDLVSRLERAIAARDRGDLAAAEATLREAAARHRGAHAPRFFLGEICYRTGRLEEAADAMAAVLAIRQDELPAFRLRAVAELRLGRSEAARATAVRGLRVAPGDPELLYLARRARGAPLAERSAFAEIAPAAAARVAGLAYEVGDAAGAAALLDRALARWPQHRGFYPPRVKLALAVGDREAARRVLDSWRRQFPDDAEASRLASGLQAAAPPDGR